MSEIAKKILEKIKVEHISPKPRWQFLLKEYVIWAIAAISALVGSFTFSVLIFRLVNNDWEILQFIHKSPIEYLFNTLPYLWVALLILFIGLAYYNARHAKGAYQYRAYWFVIGSIVVSVALGGIFYAFGLGPRVHLLSQQLPFFQMLMQDREGRWLDPDSGLLAGEVTGMLSGIGMFSLTDFNDDYWVVRPAENYISPPHFVIEPGVLVRIVGEEAEGDVFEAEIVMPYHVGPGLLPGGKLPGPMPQSGSHQLQRRLFMNR